MTKNVYQQAVESAAREAEDSGADHWTSQYIQDCRDGEREPMFTPPLPDTGEGGNEGSSGGGLFSGLRNLLTFQ